MTATVVVAALGLISTVATAWLTSRSQRRGERDGRILDARVRTYGSCAQSLYEYERAAFNRAKARLETPDVPREELRQEAYQRNAETRATIGQVAILCDEAVRDRLEGARKAIGGYSDATTLDDLGERHDAVIDDLEESLRMARREITA